ncbi:MAG TPA: HRDC domain-containing protein [Flavobacteriaceae bacterium]|nr:HRDC domain-containing protein [Flavobacteriaceae bacterium]
MKAEVFKIRMTPEYQQTDLDNLSAFLSSKKIKRMQSAFVEAEPNYWSILTFYEAKSNGSPSAKFSVSSEEELSESDIIVLDFLKAWRRDKAEQLNIPPFMICHNTELMSIAKARPKTTEELIQIKGFGEQKTARFGEDIIVMINAM